MNVPGTYLKLLHQYNVVKNKLYAALEPIVKMQSVTHFGYTFVPSRKSILEEIQHWPENAPPLPPSGWVEPRKGAVKLGKNTWEFAFHGAGLSFFHSRTHHEVSLEYTKTGELGITQWTTQMYIETLPTEEKSSIQVLLTQHVESFEQLTLLGYLNKRPPLLGDGSDDQTFVFTPEIANLG